MSLDYKVSYRKKDKSIQCIIAYKDGDTWKQRTKQGYKTQKEYKSWIDDTLDELKSVIKLPEEYRTMTWGKFKDIFLKDKKKQYSQNTKEFYKRAFSKFKALDEVPLLEIDYVHIKPCVDVMIDEGLVESTVRDYFTKMRTTFNHAINNYKVLRENPFKVNQYTFYDVSKINKKKDEIKITKASKVKALNKKEVEYLLSNLKGTDYYISLIAVKCGLRIGEIMGLVSGSIDFKNKEIHVSRQWKNLEGGIYGFGSTKSHNSYRVVPIPAKYIPELEAYTQSCVKDMNNRIFIDRKTNTVAVRLANKYRRLGLDYTVHNLRHTYATTLLANEVDYKTVAKYMGDTVQTVFDTYYHFIEDMDKRARIKLDKIL